MLGSLENAPWSNRHMVECPHCGYLCLRQDRICARCTAPLPPDRGATTHLRRPPSALPGRRQGTDHLLPNAPVTLQFLPSGICLTFTLKDPLIIGRAPGAENDFLDLTRLNASRHGVSRRHCTLRRDGTHLVVTDLDSTNGTYLNSEALIPYRDYTLHDGDRLILGTLHLTVHFVPAASAQ